MKHDRMAILCLSHARLKLAADLLRWSMNADTREEVPLREIEELISRIHKMGAAVFQAIRSRQGDHG